VAQPSRFEKEQDDDLSHSPPNAPASGAGFGMLGLAGALQSAGLLAPAAAAEQAAGRQPHFAPKAKRVIFLFMNGGPSHVDTFDPKPALAKPRRPAARAAPQAKGRLHALAVQVRRRTARAAW
jgi:hypothetical protein